MRKKKHPIATWIRKSIYTSTGPGDDPSDATRKGEPAVRCRSRKGEDIYDSEVPGSVAEKNLGKIEPGHPY
jgi:hypothetical protein